MRSIGYYYCDRVQLYWAEFVDQQVVHILQAPSIARLKILLNEIVKHESKEMGYRLVPEHLVKSDLPVFQ